MFSGTIEDPRPVSVYQRNCSPKNTDPSNHRFYRPSEPCMRTWVTSPPTKCRAWEVSQARPSSRGAICPFGHGWAMCTSRWASKLLFFHVSFDILNYMRVTQSMHIASVVMGSMDGILTSVFFCGASSERLVVST